MLETATTGRDKGGFGDYEVASLPNSNQATVNQLLDFMGDFGVLKMTTNIKTTRTVRNTFVKKSWWNKDSSTYVEYLLLESFGIILHLFQN